MSLQDQLRTEMRVLHEEVISRLALIQKGQTVPRPRGTSAERRRAKR